MERTGGKQAAQHDTPEQLLDVFKAAALSVTKLYKTSALAESRARADGYQECIEDLIMFLDRENLGLRDGEGWSVRMWATERLGGRDPTTHHAESEDENEQSERNSSPEVTRSSVEPQAPTTTTSGNSAPRKANSPQPSMASIPEEPARIAVPSQDNFTFQSSHPYPNIATLDLSDTGRTSRRHGKSGPRSTGALGRGAGAKRRWDFEDFFGGCLSGKDPFGNGGGKRSRHT